MMGQEVSERVRDVSMVVYAANRHGEFLSRLQLQKIVYLLDILALSASLLPVEYGHRAYFHGPYDPRIQQAADMLVFHGLLAAKDIRILPNDQVSCTYSMPTVGQKWLESFVTATKSLENRFRMANALADAVATRRAFPFLRQIVYAEPTFSQTGKAGFGSSLPLSSLVSNVSAQVVGLVERVLSRETVSITPEFIADVFIEYLTHRRQLMTTKDSK